MKRTLCIGLIALLAIAVFAQYPTRVYMCGSATAVGWDKTGSLPMYSNGDGTYEYVGDMIAGEFKMLTDTAWVPSYGPMVAGDPMVIGSQTVVLRSNDGETDSKFTVTAGRYQLLLNLGNQTLTVSDGTGLDDKDGKSQTQIVPMVIYPIGDATPYGWSPQLSDPIARVAGTKGQFDGVVFLTNGEFKLLHQRDWGNQYGPTTAGEQIAGAGTYSLCQPTTDLKWQISGIPSLKAFHLMVDVEAGVLVLRDTNVTMPACTKLYMIGDATGGWSLDDNAIELTSNDSVFTYSGTLSAGQLKFLEKKDFTAKAWGATTADMLVNATGEYDLVLLSADNKFMMSAGEYVLSANIKTGKFSVTSFTPSALHELSTTPKMVNKRVENGQLIFYINGQRYNALGVQL